MPGQIEVLLAFTAVMAGISPAKGNNPATEDWTNEDAISWLSRRLPPVNEWFGVVMDRVSQHFAFYMRILTVAFAIAFVMWFHIDAVSLYKGLSTDVKLRNGLLTNIQAIQNAGEQLRMALFRRVFILSTLSQVRPCRSFSC